MSCIPFKVAHMATGLFMLFIAAAHIAVAISIQDMLFLGDTESYCVGTVFLTIFLFMHSINGMWGACNKNGWQLVVFFIF